MSNMTKGYAAYVEKFGDKFEELRGVPYQVQPAGGAWWPFTLRDCEWLGELLGECAQESRRVTAREAVDRRYRGSDGVYRFDGTTATTFEDFIKKVDKLNIII